MVFLHLLGFTMGGPILPALRSHFGLEAAQTGLITSAFPLGMFVAVFVFPALSDRVGRKPVLITSYLGVGIGFVLQACALYWNAPFHVFLALRTASGCFAGASTVVKAYIADITPAHSLSRVMAYREAAGTLAFIVGPTVGGLLFTFFAHWGTHACLALVVLCCGLTSVLASVLVFLRLKPCVVGGDQPQASPAAESKDKAAAEKAKASGSDQADFWEWLTPVCTMFAISFAYNFGQAFFDTFLPIYCAEAFGWTPALLGPMLTCSACLVFLNSTFLYGHLVRSFGTVAIAIVGLCCMSGAILCIGGFPSAVWVVVAALCLYALGVPIFCPSVPTLLAQFAPRKRRGLVLGFDSAVNTVARIVSPVALGVVYQVGHARAFRTAGLVVLVGAAMMMLQKGRLTRSVKIRAAKNAAAANA